MGVAIGMFYYFIIITATLVQKQSKSENNQKLAKIEPKNPKKIKISKIQNTSFISTPMDLFHVNFQQNWGK